MAIIDPLRDTDIYITLAAERKATIKYILLTHFHADFVSGHIDLARKTGATIVYGPTAEANFEMHVAKDGEEIPIGEVKIVVIHTPGHTLESSTYLLVVEGSKPHSIYTGDTLFLGEVGRPDLGVKGLEVTKGISQNYTNYVLIFIYFPKINYILLYTEILAGYLFDSLNNRLMTLPDDVIVMPGHGNIFILIPEH